VEYEVELEAEEAEEGFLKSPPLPAVWPSLAKSEPPDLGVGLCTRLDDRTRPGGAGLMEVPSASATRIWLQVRSR
jgi:hypothetical protein